VRGLRQLDRLAQDIEDPLGDQLGSGVQSGGVDQHHELASAQAPDGVAVSQDRVQPRPDLAQYLVTGVVAETVVDLLEAVDVDEQRGHRYVPPPPASEDLLGAVEHTDPVRQVGQRVVQRSILELLGLLSDQSPGLLARAREHAIEHQDQECDQQAEAQGDQTLGVGAERVVRHPGDLELPAFAQIAALGVAR
jgi:hypothetical protein